MAGPYMGIRAVKESQHTLKNNFCPDQVGRNPKLLKSTALKEFNLCTYARSYCLDIDTVLTTPPLCLVMFPFCRVSTWYVYSEKS